jgi:glutamine amidotransferase
LIAILDYGSGNLRSAHRAFELADSNTVVTRDPEVCRRADGLVVPGVGAFAACMTQLIGAGGVEIIQERVASGKAIFGICVGMQVLFESSSEKGVTSGLGYLKGDVSEIKAPVLPHIGWNNVDASTESILFKGALGDSFYFVHSYAAKFEIPRASNAYTTYGEKFIAAVEFENIVATQFHPEKSGKSGAKLIKNWVESL